MKNNLKKLHQLIAFVIIVCCLMMTIPIVSGAETLQETESQSIPLSKVKVEWNITDVNVTCTVDKTWNPDSLCWEENKSYAATDGGADFTLTNYGSTSVKATASFTPAQGMEDKINGDVTFENNNCIVNTPVTPEQTAYEESDFTDLSEMISSTVKVNAEKFASLSNTKSGILGSYTITISEAEEMVTLTFVRTSSKATLSYNGNTYNMDESFAIQAPKNSVLSIVTTGTAGEGPTQSTLTVDGKIITQYSESGYPIVWFPVSNGDIITSNMTILTASCILSGNQVMLSDGTVKLIDDVTTEDQLMTFNFYEGKLDGNYPMYVMKHENMLANVITVTLDNGTVLEMCDWQQFFDMDEKTYFDIDAINYREAVGRNVLFIENGRVTSAKIVLATMKPRVCTSYEIFTEYNKNFVANGILTVEPETYLSGVYTIGDDLKIDMEQYQIDVNTYGKYTYEEFADFMTEHEFEIMNIADKKIAVGKGIVSEDWLFDLYKEWMPMYR